MADEDAILHIMQREAWPSPGLICIEAQRDKMSHVSTTADKTPNAAANSDISSRPRPGQMGTGHLKDRTWSQLSKQTRLQIRSLPGWQRAVQVFAAQVASASCYLLTKDVDGLSQAET